MKLINIYGSLCEDIQIKLIDPEVDWPENVATRKATWLLYNSAHGLARRVGINPDKDKEPTILAIYDNQVIGAVFTHWQHDRDASQSAGEPIAVWSFDVVVDRKLQGQNMIGIKLIKAAEDRRSQLELQLNMKAYTRLYVVNDKLSNILQRRYGYVDNGAHHLVKM